MNNLYRKIYDAGCIKFGEFKLKSGIISPVYCDFRGLVGRPELLKEIGEALGDRAKQIGCDRIAGIPYAGLPLGVATSLASGIPMIYPRKEAKDYGTKKLIEGQYAQNDKVLVIDDIITDGASKIEAITPLQEAGLVVKDVLIILDREQGGDKILAKAGYKLHSLGALSEILSVLTAAGRVEPAMQAKVLEFIEKNQFGR
jgi:uridine monophosphate synthetase